ncbi:ATP-binding protein [Pedobacter nutrimenti]|uniref:PAS domain-containing sensor histidine kinase n=1 Tax=Pedobacter nutrimenti TaxID=1241337 RepID=UPI00293143FB|nr:ATP-binding protein [Pedobacter nutrimenti]
MPQNPNAKSHLQYLKDGGEMGRLTRAYNWSETTLGDPENWSLSLLTTIGIMLKSKFPMFLWWGDELIQFYNDAYRPSLGNEGKHPKALGQHGAECWPEIWPVIKPLIDQVMQGGPSTWSEDQLIPIYRNNQLEDVYWTFSYSKVDDESGMPGGVLVICSETTEKVLNFQKIENTIKEQERSRKKTEKAESMLRFSIEAANAGTWNMDRNSKQFIASDRMKELYGYHSNDPMTAEDAISNIAEEYREKVRDMLYATLNRNEYFNVEYPVQGRNDGKNRWLRVFGRLYPDSNGNLTHFSGLLIEITEQKLDELRKNDFIGMVSHELKTPLTSLTGYVQLLKAKLKGIEDTFVTNTMERALGQVKKMNTLINGFLNISRLESGKIQLHKDNFQLDMLIKDIVEETTHIDDGHILSLSNCQPVNIYADRDKIGSVISNLLSNAVKYSPKGKRIEINCEIKQAEVQVSITDEGIGIQQADVDKLFQRFYRVESNHTQNISGFGIGLYLSAEIVQRHGGKIWVESKSGHGSTFFFTLPLTIQ